MRWLRSLDIPAEWLWLQNVTIIAVAILIAVVVHAVAMRIAGHAARRTASQSDDLVLEHIRQPLRWVAIAIAVSFAVFEGLALYRNTPTLSRWTWTVSKAFPPFPFLMGFLCGFLACHFGGAGSSRLHLSTERLKHEG